MRYDKSILEVNMSCPNKNQSNITKDAKLQAELSPRKEAPNLDTVYENTGTPPIPMIPDDDIDDGDEGFPLITSVFSLASLKEGEKVDLSEPQKSPDKELTEVTSSNVTSTVVSVTTNNSRQGNGGNVSPRTIKVLAPSKPKLTLDTKSGPDRDNAPYYVGKGKLILPKPKPEDGKLQGSPPKSTMAFSKMMSISPQNNGNTLTVNSTTDGSKENPIQTSGMMTRSAAHKMSSQKNDVSRTISQGGTTVAGVNASGHISAVSFQTQAIPASSSSQPHVTNLSNTVQMLNVKGAQSQATMTPLAPQTTSGSAMSTSVFSSSSPLVQLIKRIAPSTSVTTISPGQGTTMASSTHAPLVTAIAPTPVNVQVRSMRHVNIAPAPTAQQIVTTTPPVNTVNTTRFVMVPKTVAHTSTISATKVVSAQGGVSLPRVVMVPKAVNTQGTAVQSTQVLYFIENQGTGDGKTYRILIPEQKVVQSAGAAPSQGQMAILSKHNVSNVSPAQLVRIIPKPAGTTVVNPQPKPPLVTQTLSTPTNVTSNVSTVTPVLNTVTTTMVPTVVTSTTPIATTKDTATPMLAEDSTSSLSSSSAPAEEATPSEDFMDTGLSPHEARIQKLKELLRTQEQAVDRLREKRQKEIDDVRAPSGDSSDYNTGAAIKRDSPFAVPLPPKKARLEHYRSKLKETNQTVKDGFLPNTDDNQFVKLVGLEKVVDKLKAKKMLELKDSQAN